MPKIRSSPAGNFDDTRRLPKRRLRLAALPALSLLLSLSSAQAEYQLDVGDVLEISVTGMPELQHRVLVQFDGTVSFPLLGSLPVAGLSRTEAQTKIQGALATKIFRRMNPDGREIAIVLEPSQITVTLAEYRPIYVDGDVAKPGEHAYRPSMTVRQAIALSGGYDILRGRMTDPFLQAADLRSDYEALWTEFAKEQLHAVRLKTELGDKDHLEAGAIDAPISRSTMAEFATVESEYLQTSQADYHREQAFLKHAVKQADEQIGVLGSQEQKEEQGVQADLQELQKATELFSRGTLTSPRVTDARRAVLISSTRKLQTTAQLMQQKKQQDEFSRQLERLDDQRRILLLRELQETKLRLGVIRAKLQGTSEKLRYTTNRLQVVQGTRAQPDIAIHRRGNKGWERFHTIEEAELQPGDIIEVNLQLEHSTAASER
jgi:polysaccharide export outer membrane protein